MAVLMLAAAPLSAQESPSCDAWSIKGIYPGMTLEEARGDRQFTEVTEYRESFGFTRYLWQSKTMAEKIDLHVDTREQPHRVVGVMTTIPSSESAPRKYFLELRKKWGNPESVKKQGAFNLYTWTNVPCDVSALAGVMNTYHEVGVWMALNSISIREEVERLKRQSNATAPQTPVER